MCTAYSNMVRYIYDLKKKVLCIIRRESRKILISHRVVDQLSPHHDSQFSAFSTEVFDQMNRKHNRSNSPITTLADRAERKVAITGAGQPNYWPKTWFRADAYKAKLATPKYAIELFGLLLATHLFPNWAPGRLCRGASCNTAVAAVLIKTSIED